MSNFTARWPFWVEEQQHDRTNASGSAVQNNLTCYWLISFSAFILLKHINCLLFSFFLSFLSVRIILNPCPGSNHCQVLSSHRAWLKHVLHVGGGVISVISHLISVLLSEANSSFSSCQSGPGPVLLEWEQIPYYTWFILWDLISRLHS